MRLLRRMVCFLFESLFCQSSLVCSHCWLPTYNC
jgi:hypothetical protein